ncbi:helix-hairpin-helix domain-containing protein [Candidatus Roizmanbacteria bacterium]|nr:helix-hairpin-helix domain-containing protein [Candidatus Roizmanbacteria bacterium]
MNGFIKSFLPILKRLRKFKVELILLTIAFCTGLVSFIIYIKGNSLEPEESEMIKPSVLSATSSHIVVDIAGAVEHPGVYETTSGARLKDAFILAGGLSTDAERDYIARNFNLAKLVTDQEKIYVPFRSEIISGIFAEPQKVLDYTSPVNRANPVVQNSNSQKISINSATLEELDTLTGIGKTTAEKIIKNRPYKSIEELLSKKLVNKNVYGSIKNLITN